MLPWFNKRKTEDQPLFTDIHSHLLPALDDGVQSFEQAEVIIRRFASLGYRRLITTPHIMSDSYRNTPEGIREKLAELREYLWQAGISIEIHAAAEYYLDEDLSRKITAGEEMLTFGENYLLFETNFLTEPFNLKEFIFQITTKGYKPVLAHPERYLYLQQDFRKIEDLLDRGVLMQVNTSSFTGHYSRPAQLIARKLVDSRNVHFLGTDCHHEQHVNLLEKARRDRFFKKALSLPLLNHEI